MAIEIPRDTKREMISSIRKYFSEKLEEDIGDLKAEFLLDFCLKEIAPTVYNQAIRDAQAYFQERAIDLDGTCYEPELAYWKKSAK